MDPFSNVLAPPSSSGGTSIGGEDGDVVVSVGVGDSAESNNAVGSRGEDDHSTSSSLSVSVSLLDTSGDESCVEFPRNIGCTYLSENEDAKRLNGLIVRDVDDRSRLLSSTPLSPPTAMCSVRDFNSLVHNNHMGPRATLTPFEHSTETMTMAANNRAIGSTTTTTMDLFSNALAPPSSSGGTSIRGEDGDAVVSVGVGDLAESNNVVGSRGEDDHSASSSSPVSLLDASGDESCVEIPWNIGCTYLSENEDAECLNGLIV